MILINFDFQDGWGRCHGCRDGSQVRYGKDYKENLSLYVKISPIISYQRSRLVNVLTIRSGKGYAEDYYLDAKSQCAGRRGACPDK